MAAVFITHDLYLDHEPGRGHPERPDRLRAVMAGVERAGLGEALVPRSPRPAERSDLERVHRPGMIDRLFELCASGGGPVDADTAISARSCDAALLAAGAGLTAVKEIDAGTARSAFCAVRPPGHHATPGISMGFCLFNNVAVTAAALAARGETVLIVDFDAHHGNGTQDAFWEDSRVGYVSFHQHPLYPGTGDLHEVGEGAGRGSTLNVPLPPGATGDVQLAAVEAVVAPFAERLRPTWLLLSAGFDAHRSDPLTDLALSARDFGDVTTALLEAAPGLPCIAFLEGGYDLDALGASAAACLGALVGEAVSLDSEGPTSGGPGRSSVEAAALVHRAIAAG